MPTPPLSLEELQATVDAYNRVGGSWAGAAKALGISQSGLQNRLNRARVAGLWDGNRPSPYIVQQQMAQVGGDASRASHGWIITPQDDGGRVSTFWKNPQSEQDRETLAETIRAAFADIEGKAKPKPVPAHCDADLLNLFPIPDAHLGLHSWRRETGEDYDLSTAKALLRDAMERIVARSPRAETAVLLGLGDLLHGNDQRNATPRSGHQLDVDGRHMKVMEVAVWTIIGAVEILLQTHKRVIVELLGGNHDPEASLMLLVALRAFYARESRVAVDQDARAWWTLQHGETLLAATHGHAIKQPQMPGYLAAEWPDLWGQTRHRYIFSGHIHHERTREFPGVLCEALRPVTARDAYAAAAFVSQRELTAMTFHRRFGRVGRIYEALPLEAAA